MRPHTLPTIVLSKVVLLLAIASIAAAAPTSQPDAVDDAVRQGAEKAMRDGKHAEAATLISKVIEGAGARWQDYQLLARASEKLKQDREAAVAYRKVVELTSDTSERREERAAYREATLRLRTLDVLGGKVETLVKDTQKQVNDLLKDAEKAGDWDILGKLLKLLATLKKTQGEDCAYFEVKANKSYQNSGFRMQQGKTYRIRAAGRWTLSPKVECGPDGVKSPTNSPLGSQGTLLVLVSQDKDNYKLLKVGSDLTWSATISGVALFVINEDKFWEPAGKEDNSGSMHLLIERIEQ